MTMVTDIAAASSARRKPLVDRLGVPLAAVFIAALFAICHPYLGIRGDSSIYMMRALADLDPAGLGRDLMVVDAGQMRFSLFPLLVRPLVAAFGASNAAMIVAALGSAAWLCGLACLARGLAPGRVAWAMVAMVAVLPVSYGYLDFGPFSFAETAATPRPLAEAAVLAALAAILAGRPPLAAALLGLALLIHPLMALAGLGVASVIVLWRLPSTVRKVVVCVVALAGVGAVLLGRLGVPGLDRLAIIMDPAWFGLVVERSPHLLPTLWPSNSFPPLFAQVATIVVAAHRAPPAQRQLYIATLIVGALGFVASVLFTDTLHVLLFVQAQTWRAVWLVAVVGGCALAFCTATLWRGDNLARIVLALLALAWFFQPSPMFALALAGLVLVLELSSFGRQIAFQRRHVAVLYALVGIAAVYWAIGPLIGYAAYLRSLDPGETSSLISPLRNNLHTLPLCLAIAAWLVAPRRFHAPVLGPAALALGSLGLLAANVWGWDQRGIANASLETLQAPPGLAELGADRNREVLWLGDNSDAWFALGRPQFFSPQQAVSIVFSRPLAQEWTRRADLLIALGLEPRGVFRPWERTANNRIHVTQPAVDKLCARPDAPGLVLFSLGAGQSALRDMITWTLAAPVFRVEPIPSGETRRIDAIGIVPCAPRMPHRLDQTAG